MLNIRFKHATAKYHPFVFPGEKKKKKKSGPHLEAGDAS
jgi:hypothetical protein